MVSRNTDVQDHVVITSTSLSRKEMNCLKKLKAGNLQFIELHRKISKLRSVKKAGRRLTEAKQRQLIRDAIRGENHMKATFGELTRLFSEKKEFASIYRKLKEDPEFFRENSHPVDLSEKARRGIAAMGITLSEVLHYHHQLCNTKNWEVLKKRLREQSPKQLLKQAQKVIDESHFPESVAAIREAGLVSVTGAGGLIGGLTMLIGVGLIIANFVPLGIALIVVGMILIVESVSQAVALEIADPGETGALEEDTNEYFIGNISRSKMEVHRSFCHTLQWLKPTNKATFSSLESAHAEALDNCHYCIGNSTR